MPLAVRPHLITPRRATAAVSVNLSDIEMTSGGQLTVPVNMPGAWVISNQTLALAGCCLWRVRQRQRHV